MTMMTMMSIVVDLAFHIACAKASAYAMLSTVALTFSSS
jgi:hypothetical protein